MATQSLTCADLVLPAKGGVAGGATGLSEVDLNRVLGAAAYIRANDVRSVIAASLPALSQDDQAALVDHCRFSHAALLVFPGSTDQMIADLASADLEVTRVTPSVVVRGRLCDRYGLEDADVAILTVPIRDRAGEPCFIEIFALVTSPELATIAVDEWSENHEWHLALQVVDPDPVVLGGLARLLTECGQMSPDGGGYNCHEGSTVMYFRGPATVDRAHRRLELISSGHFPESLAGHLKGAEPPAERLLRLMTGAWATQAIKVAAQLRLPDHLAAGKISVEELARITGAHPDGLLRLLRYLAALGVVRSCGTEFALTEVGMFLRGDVDDTLHPLALLYGGPFYESFARLDEAVHTGRESFALVFGEHHFPYFAAHPHLSDLFDRAMAASAAMFGGLAEVVDFTRARVVVDVGGGNGQLLSRILTAHPHLEGVLFERGHVLAAAKSAVANAGCADRCALVEGDFTTSIPSEGDVYILSRVLHDWDDAQCAAILQRCAEAMPERAELLVVERLLPEAEADSLAVAWDVHMLCNVGGRERTQGHYRALLAEAGFDLVERQDLPLEAAVLRAVKR